MMTNIQRQQQQIELLKRYPRAIVHMWQRIYGTRSKNGLDIFDTGNRFGIVLGAGAGMDLGFPSWNALIDKLAAHKDVDATSRVASIDDLALKAQIVYQTFRERAIVSAVPATPDNNRCEIEMTRNWQTIVHGCLYEGVPSAIKKRTKKDKYLKSLLRLVRKTYMTVTYNFDDTLELLLEEARSPQQRNWERGYASIWGPDAQLLPRKAVVYHVNGFLPTKLSDRPSEDVVLLDGSFADQLIDSMSGRYTMLLNHLAQNTCLLVGMSLQDATLKHHLRQTARRHPGLVHYYVRFVPKGKKVDAALEQSETDYLFDVYNLVSLYLDEDGVRALADLLDLERDDFDLQCEQAGIPKAYRYFLTGCVAVGKSTAVSHFRNLQTHDEWLERRLPDMNIAPTLTTKPIQDKIDQWVDAQIAKKNRALRYDGLGIHIVDRAPLDAFAFKKGTDWVNRAKAIQRALDGEGTDNSQLVSARIILLTGDPDMMAVRAAKRHKSTDAQKLRLQQEKLRFVYTGIPGVVSVDTTNKSRAQVAKEISRLIHFQPYVAADLQERLTKIKNRGVSWPHPD